MASTISVFNTLMLGQGPATLYGPGDFVNDVKRRRYVLAKHLSGEHTKHIAGGNLLQEVVYLAGNSQMVDYNPAAPEFAYDNPQPGTKISADWRFTAGFISWDNPEIMLNTGKSFSRDHNIAKFKDVHDMKHLNFATQQAEHFEDQMWAKPVAAMEVGGSGLVPSSLPMFINEFSDVDNPTATGITGLFPGLTTVQGVAPGTLTKWQNAKATFDSIGVDDGTGVHLFGAFDEMILKTDFDQLPMDAQYSGPRDTPAYIACSLKGHKTVTAAYRMNQDWFRWKGNDAYQKNPTFAGIEICYVSALDTAALYTQAASPSASSTFVAEDSLDISDGGQNQDAAGAYGWAGPRFYFVNAKQTPKIFHSERYMVKEDPRNPKGTMPFSWIMPCDTWHQNFCRSRRMSGIVTPQDNITGFGVA